MNRIDRVTAILIQLQSKKIIKAQDIADRFYISLRTVYRDIRTLEQAGVPIIGEAGVGYSIMEGYRLPPVMFTKEEATAFLTAEKLIEKLTDAATEKNYKSAMYKVRAVLRSAEKDMLEGMEDGIEVLPDCTRYSTGSLNNALPVLLKTISNKEIVQIRYITLHSNETTERAVEPIGIFYASDYWHLIAFCHLRNDYRDFRVDRITAVVTTTEKFRKQHPPLKEYLEQAYKDQDLKPVTIRVRKEITRYLQKQKYNYGFITEQEKNGFMEMSFLSASLEGFARWYLMFADNATIIEPEMLNESVRSLVFKLYSRM